ncbi:MAG: class I SAM-dependent methyltransferase [Candidatus Hydrogenedentes bacterium]|nr:class I SAM-dependent methyltransferase [Candidatus Hydrogenedentota bacterium]
MRSFKHWSIRYACDKARTVLYERAHPSAPWLTSDANEFLDVWLLPSHAGFEWGAGRSTVWLAQRVKSLTSVESDPVWRDRVQGWLGARGQINVNLLHIAADSPDYAGAVNATDDESLDFALVDGVDAARGECVAAVMGKIRPGGLCVVDDVQRYLPSNSRAPESIPPDGDPCTPLWANLAEKLSSWKLIRTSNGVKDTAIWRKPGK